MERIGLGAALARQPEAVALSVRAVDEQLPDQPPAPRRPLLVGMGASHAALAACVYHLRAAGVWAQRAGHGELPNPVATGDADLVVGLSQSGRSAETVATLQGAAEQHRLAVVNVPGSPLTQVASRVLGCGDVPDSKVSSCGFSATLVGLGMLVDTWTRGGPDEMWHRVGHQVREVADSARTTLAPWIPDIAGGAAVDVVGGGAALSAAEEGALLVREATRLPAAGYETRQYLHGPMESCGATHVLIGGQREAAVGEQLSEAGRRVLYVGPCTTSVPSVPVPALPGMARTLVETVVLQQLASLVADARGVRPEEFRFSVEDTKVDAVPAEGP